MVAWWTGFRQDVRRQDNPGPAGEVGPQQAAHQEAHERLHGVGPGGTPQDPQGLPRHAQLQHQQNPRSVSSTQPLGFLSRVCVCVCVCVCVLYKIVIKVYIRELCMFCFDFTALFIFEKLIK